jgi:hypothetical protein
MSYFGRTPKKPGQLGVSGAGRTLAGFGPASGGPQAGTLRHALRVVSRGRVERPGVPARQARAAFQGRTTRSARAAR